MSEDTTTTTEQEPVEAQETEQPLTPETQAVQTEETKPSEVDTTIDQTDESSEDDELMEWANKKGIKTDDTVAILKMVRESEKQMHNATKQAKELQSTVNTVGEDAGYDETSQLLNRLKVTDFYLSNPGAKELDVQMAEIVKSKPYLAEDLETVYELAKARNQPIQTIDARKIGQKEALAQVAKAQKAAPPQASATTRQSTKEIGDADIANMTLKEYEAFKKETGFNPFKA